MQESWQLSPNSWVLILIVVVSSPQSKLPAFVKDRRSVKIFCSESRHIYSVHLTSCSFPFSYFPALCYYLKQHFSGKLFLDHFVKSSVFLLFSYSDLLCWDLLKCQECLEWKTVLKRHKQEAVLGLICFHPIIWKRRRRLKLHAKISRNKKFLPACVCLMERVPRKTSTQTKLPWQKTHFPVIMNDNN